MPLSESNPTISPAAPSEIRYRYDTLTNHLEDTCTQLHRPPPRLICMAKLATATQIATLHQGCGQVYFGENRLQSLKHKVGQLQQYKLKWIYYGALQSRVIPDVVKLCDEIHSVASLKELTTIVRTLSRLGPRHGPLPLFIQVSCGEPHKRGLHPSELAEVLEPSRWPAHLIHLRGIMVMPPLTHSLYYAYTKRLSMVYHEMAALKDRLGLPGLSMGMSLDWPAALQVGATDIRIGRQIFGGAHLNELALSPARTP